MSDLPFGFGTPDPDEPREDTPVPGGSRGGSGPGAGGPVDPFGGLFGGLGGIGGGNPLDPAAIGAMLQQLGRFLSWQGGPVNWDLAREAARHAVAAAGDATVSGAERRDVEEALRIADLWLDEATAFPASTTTVRAWSRAEWVEGTLGGWKDLVEPVAERVVEAMGRSVPPDMAQAAAPLMGMMRQVGVSLWGGQVGQAIGTLATEVLGSTDLGVPLTAPGTAVLLPANVRAFGDGLGLDARDVLVYSALREAARHRLHAHAPWLRAHVVALVEAYGRGIDVDTSRIEEALRDLDPTRPEGLQEAMESGLFAPRNTPEQEASLLRLETALALVEGWVDDVVARATADRLGTAGALRESVRRARATGGAAEQVFATLVGLELRPRRLREAAALWQLLREHRGVDGRDAVWAHPDLLPSAEHLDDPENFVTGTDAPSLDLTGLADLPDEEPPSRPADG